MDLSQALHNIKFDTRMKDMNLKLGLVTKEEIETNTKNLQDRAADCEEVTLEDKGDFEG